MENKKDYIDVSSELPHDINDIIEILEQYTNYKFESVYSKKKDAFIFKDTIVVDHKERIIYFEAEKFTNSVTFDDFISKMTK